MYDIKVNFKKKYVETTLCPFSKKCDETFEHTLQSPEGLICPKELQNTKLVNVADGSKSLHKIGRYLIKFNKFRKLVI